MTAIPFSRGVPPFSPARHARPPFMVLPSVAYCFYPPAGMAGGLFPPNGAYPVNGGSLTQVAEVVLVVVDGSAFTLRRWCCGACPAQCHPLAPCKAAACEGYAGNLTLPAAALHPPTRGRRRMWWCWWWWSGLFFSIGTCSRDRVL